MDEPREAGSHRVHWDGMDDAGRPLSSGVYVCRLQADACRDAIRLTLVR